VPLRLSVKVAFKGTFTALSAGGLHTCGLTTGGAAYCWGDGWTLGAGTEVLGMCFSQQRCSPTPVRVAGELTFAVLSAGGSHTCGLTTAAAGYCWGGGVHGELGDGSQTGSAVPVAVTGGLTFATLSAGVDHSCGVTLAGVAYCWGDNRSGQLGDGTRTSSSVPVKVLGQP